MATYIVEGTYQTPEWWTVELEADDELEAEEQAIAQMKITAPEEAIEFDIIETRLVN